MNFKRKWRNRRNTVGFAGECARLALSFYRGNHRPALVQAIEIAEAFSRVDMVEENLEKISMYRAEDLFDACMVSSSFVVASATSYAVFES